jgi:hypothetical protein
MDEANPGVELRIPRQACFDPGHANQDQAQLAPVIEIPHLLQAGGFESVGFIDDDELGVVTVWSLIEEIIGSTAEGQPPPHERVYERTELRELTRNHLRGIHHRGRVHDRAALKRLWGQRVIEDPPPFCQDDIPSGVIVGRQGFPDAERAITQADIAMTTAGVAKLGKPPVFLGHEKIRHGSEGLLIHAHTASDVACHRG